MDTALEFPGQVLNPNIINNYQGEDIILKNGVNLNTKDLISYHADNIIDLEKHYREAVDDYIELKKSLRKE